MKKRYYVYAHYKPNGELFYVGKGTGNRNETPTARSEEWLNEAKDGFNTAIIADNLNNKQAFLIEQSVIRAINPMGLTNKKIPSDIVEPYWKKNKIQQHVSIFTPLNKAIPAIEKQIDSIHFTDEETELMSLKRKDCNEEEKSIRDKAIAKRYKLKELNERLNKAKNLLKSKSGLYA